MGTDALDKLAHALDICAECGSRLDREPPTDRPCPDCRAEIGEPCHIDCSSRWT